VLDPNARRSPLRLVGRALAALLAATVPVALASGVHTAQASVAAPTGSAAASVNATADAYVDSAHPSSNYSTGSTLYVDG
jgi:hypothetical protein